MTQASTTLFGTTRPLIEFDPQRLPRLPALLGALLLAVALPLALGAAFAPALLMRWLPFIQSSGANALLALALLGAAVLARQGGRAAWCDLLTLLVVLLAAIPLGQGLLGLYAADGPQRLLFDVRPLPGGENFWPGRMSIFTSLGLLLAASCLFFLVRLGGSRSVKLWLVQFTALFVLGLLGALGQLVGVPLLVSPHGEGAEMGMGTALGLLALVLVLFRLAIGAPAVAAYFDGRPDRSVFALSVTGLLAMLVVGGVLTSGLLAGVGLQGHREALGESLRTHLLLADAEFRVVGRIADEARRRADAGELDWFVVAEGLAGARAGSVAVRIDPAGASRAPGEGSLRLPLRGEEQSALLMRGGWWMESRRALADGRGDLVVEMPFAPFDRLAERIAEVGRSGELVVCGRAHDEDADLCFPTRQIGRAFERMLVQARKAEPTPMARALAGESGIAQVRDYRQRKVVVAYAPLGASGAGVALKIDVVELQAPLRRALWLGVLLILVVALTGGALVYRHVRPLIMRMSRTERALKRAQAVAQVGSWYASARSGEIVWSDETYRIFAMPHGTRMNHERFMACVHPDDRARVEAAWMKALEGAPYDIEHRILAAGEVRWVRERAELEFDAGGAMSGATGTVEDVTERKAREAELLDSRQKLRDLGAHHEKLREEERTHIAREIHDELGQHLTALRMDAALLQLQFGESNPELAQKVSGMKKLIDRTIKVVRGVASSLRPAALDLGLASAAEWLVGEFRARSGVTCTLELPAHELALDDARATVVFRILQESLTNVSRHANARNVEVSIAQRAGMVVLAVRDDGGGFDPAQVGDKKTFGLMGIRERAMMFGGSARLSSRPGEGTLLEVEMPLDDNDSGKDR